MARALIFTSRAERCPELPCVMRRGEDGPTVTAHEPPEYTMLREGGWEPVEGAEEYKIGSYGVRDRAGRRQGDDGDAGRAA